MKTYSLDLRQKIVEAYDRGEGTIEYVADLFGVSSTFIKKMLHQRRTRGDLSPLPHGGGHVSLEKKNPDLRKALEQLLEHEMAGNPMNDQTWVRCSAERLANQLRESGFQISMSTVWRMLKKMGLSMRANKKKITFRSDGPEEEQQFRYIALQRRVFREATLPIISVDTKKKESIGNFYNKGRAWCEKAPEVNTYDFISMADCRAVPYGIYDIQMNKGYVFVGISNDTPEFAVDSIVTWWKIAGKELYPKAKSLLILADSGGSNGFRVRAWRQHLQEKLSDHLNLTVTVCHYPPGCSKWNPIERRLFSFISINWAGKPLKSLDMMLGYIRGTSTKTGLIVHAELQGCTYKKGQKVTKEMMDSLNMQAHDVCPKWNYTISPRSDCEQ